MQTCTISTTHPAPPMPLLEAAANEKLASGVSNALSEANVWQTETLTAESWRGNDYMHARYYSHNLGRFLSVDPVGGSIGSSQSWNRYSYVMNNPVSMIDPDGELAWFVVPIVIAAVIAAENANTPESTADPTLTAPETRNHGAAMFEGGTLGGVATVGAGIVLDQMQPSPESTPGIQPAPEPGPCFAAGTVVMTDLGERSIEDLKVGDRVWGFDEETGRTDLFEVTNTFVHQADHLHVLSVGGWTIHTTDNHPFWLNGDWREAGSLKRGDWLKTKSGSSVAVESGTRLDGVFTVYNIEVDEAQTYFVSPLSVLVHNKASTPRKSSKAIRREWENSQGESWPKDENTGRNQDVAHMEALADGGTNDLSNIEPKPHDVHMKEHKDAGDFRRWGARAKKKKEEQ